MIRTPLALLALWVTSAALGAASTGSLQWSELPPLPDELGFAGPFVGTHNGALVVAGGANFPEKPPWEGGAKVWHDSVFVLEKPDGAWKPAGKLPRPLGYGVALSAKDGVVCIGGSNAQRHYAEVFLLRWENGEIKTLALPSLPKPCANLSGALLGNTVYVAGGIETPTATNALKTFWSLDLTAAQPPWRELEPWPGPARMLAVAAVQDKSFFLVSGAELSGDAQGKPVRRHLNDAYRYQPGRGWQRVADLPRPAVAAPSPAPALGQSTFLVMGGDDGSLVSFQPLDLHPGFPKTILAYHTITDTWKPLGTMPAAHVTTTLAHWNGGWVMPSGEVRPGVRSPAVWTMQASFQKAAFGWLNYGMVLLYLLGMVRIGFVCSKKNKSTNDFFRGGQRIPWWAAGLSIFATMLSSITFMAIPAAAYTDGWNLFLANSYILITPLVVFVYLPFYRTLNVTSAYEYLERRFNAATRLAGSTLFMLYNGELELGSDGGIGLGHPDRQPVSQPAALHREPGRGAALCDHARSTDCGARHLAQRAGVGAGAGCLLRHRHRPLRLLQTATGAGRRHAAERCHFSILHHVPASRGGRGLDRGGHFRRGAIHAGQQHELRGDDLRHRFPPSPAARRG